ncbi:hypothetical protein BLNAU_2376 [Blattamonas nauphoetae]|uniref:Uncharacterized protein n=1 Tax=Blattamonas nauphoetae TaxID=2049346 RepID=A0ABQ9YFN9_9EUKA|nr:hypothetical protein BLNAU_2376 [Blattamonas nauphoetae]
MTSFPCLGYASLICCLLYFLLGLPVWYFSQQQVGQYVTVSVEFILLVVLAFLMVNIRNNTTLYRAGLFGEINSQLNCFWVAFVIQFLLLGATRALEIVFSLKPQHKLPSMPFFYILYVIYRLYSFAFYIIIILTVIRFSDKRFYQI